VVEVARPRSPSDRLVDVLSSAVPGRTPPGPPRPARGRSQPANSRRSGPRARRNSAVFPAVTEPVLGRQVLVRGVVFETTRGALSQHPVLDHRDTASKAGCNRLHEWRSAAGPAALPLRLTSSAWPTVRASGFSTITCLPASRARHRLRVVEAAGCDVTRSTSSAGGVLPSSSTFSHPNSGGRGSDAGRCVPASLRIDPRHLVKCFGCEYTARTAASDHPQSMRLSSMDLGLL